MENLILAKPMLFGVAVSLNNFAACLALGTLGQLKRRFRVATVSSIFAFLFPLVGIWAGNRAFSHVEEISAWLGPTVIGGFGLWMTLQSKKPTQDEIQRRGDVVTSWRRIVIFGILLNLDNIFIDFGLGLGSCPAFLLAAVSGVLTFLFSLLGMWIGHFVELYWEQRATFASGVLLIVLSISILFKWL